MVYQRIKLNLTPAQQKKALKGAAIRLKANDIGTGYIVMLHPVNYRKLTRAKQGVMLDLSQGEIIATASFHGLVPTPSVNIEGSGIFDDIWSGIKKVGNFVRDSGIGTILADSAAAAAVPVLGPAGSTLARKVFQGVTGVGIAKSKRAKKTTGSGLYL